MRKIILKVCFFVAFGLVSSVPLHAQTTQGTIKGRVTSPIGAVIPGAKVLLKRQSTKESFTAFRETTADYQGEYAFRDVPFGVYEVRIKVNWIPRDFTKRIELTSKQPAEVDVVFTFVACSDEQDTPTLGKLTPADHAEIVRILVGLLLGDVHSTSSPDRKIILSPDNFSQEWLSTEHKLRTSILTRSAIQELTEKNGELTYYSLTKPIQTGRCVGISVLINSTVKGQLENANMAGGADNYEFRKVDGKWTWLLLSSEIS